MDLSTLRSDDIVVRNLLERNAAEAPDELFVSFEDGETWTRRDGLHQAYRAAHRLREHGVRPGDRVAVFAGNGADYLRAWWGTAVLGAVLVPINVSYRGAILEHLLSLSAPTCVVLEPEYAERIDSVPGTTGLTRVDVAELRHGPTSPPASTAALEQWDPHVLLLTSGTTGPSKLAEIPYRTSFTGGAWLTLERGANREDTLLVDLPLFHGGALYQTHGALAARTRLAIRSRPELRRYWEIVRDSGATYGFLLSSMVTFLLSQPERPAERAHSLKVLSTSPLPPDAAGFQKRFGVGELITSYGSTEAPAILGRGPGEELVEGYCGRVRPGFEVRLVDQNDFEVPAGEPGEAVVRTLHPWMMMSGYVNDPEAQTRAMRNGWFHTGDLLRRDGDDNYFFVDRAKDSLRRRGENVSSFEVEREVQGFPSVAEVACVAFRGDGDIDDEVKVWVVPGPEAEIDFEKLLLYCAERLPHFMVPRYFEAVDAFPKTPSARVQKFELRRRGNGPDTWDREAHGLHVTREGLRRTPSGS